MMYRIRNGKSWSTDEVNFKGINKHTVRSAMSLVSKSLAEDIRPKVEGRKVFRSIAVGRYPFGVTLSPDGTKAYVGNMG